MSDAGRDSGDEPGEEPGVEGDEPSGLPDDRETTADDEVGLDEGAAGSDTDDESASPSSDEDAEPLAPKARPARATVDPLLRAANKPCRVRIVPPDQRITDSRLHLTEASLIVSMRAQQISDHGTTFTKGEGAKGRAGLDPVNSAKYELLTRRCPFRLRRVLSISPGGTQTVEEWNPREMALPHFNQPTNLGGRAGGAQ